jgi:hypothetical protein
MHQRLDLACRYVHFYELTDLGRSLDEPLPPFPSRSTLVRTSPQQSAETGTIPQETESAAHNRVIQVRGRFVLVGETGIEQ